MTRYQLLYRTLAELGHPVPRRRELVTRYQLLYRTLAELGHPVRLEILTMCQRGTASPREIADQSGATIGVVAYHVRTMANDGLIKLAAEKRRRGAVEHFYTLTARGRRLHRDLLETP